MIWGTVAINSDEAKEYETAPEETGLANFLQITTLNVVMAYLYVFSHICACPIGICIVAMNPHIIGMRRQEDLTDEELDLMNDPVGAERIRAQRKERADRAMNNLSRGNFTTLASSYV